MGGCCCSSRKPQLHVTPIYYYYPPALEEHDSLRSHDSAVARTPGFLVDLNLDASSPDTYRRPPTPIPFDVVLGYPQPTDSQFPEETINESSFHANCKERDCKAETGAVLDSPRKSGVELLELKADKFSKTEEEDLCPTCLEDYEAENPKIITKCNHHFHLSCILEWMERSDTCPICDKEMDFEAL